MTVSATAYCIEGTTKSGMQTRVGIVAADPAVLPIGTVISVDGLTGRHNRTYTVADTGRAVKGREIDIFMDDCAAAKRFGRQRARVRIK
jgi:3D (Asp-Asp-Asp) domain-containing protein